VNPGSNTLVTGRGDETDSGGFGMGKEPGWIKITPLVISALMLVAAAMAEE